MTIVSLPSTLTQSTPVAGDQFAALRVLLVGDLITGESAEFDAIRKVVNLTVDRRPLAIVRAADAEDVAAAVSFAHARNLPLAVRSGGHSIAKYSMIDDALVVDLSTMKAVSI